MDTFNVDPITLLDQAENVARLRWNDLNEKRKFLEESLNEVNSERENLKAKLALSQQRAGEIEQEKDRLAQIVKEFQLHLLTSPLYKLIGKVSQGVDVLGTYENSAIQPVATNFNHTANNQIVSGVSGESGSYCFNVTVPKMSENDDCSSAVSTSQNRSISSEHLVNSSSSAIQNVSDIRPENANSSEINESTIKKDDTSLNLVTNQTTTQYGSENDVLITGENTNSDIELVLSDDENFEPPIFDKELVICLPMMEYIPKDEPVSCETSDCDSGTSNKSPRGCIICEQVFTTEDELKGHIKKIHLNQYCEIKKLAIDFREKPKLLPRLRSRDKKSQISTVSSSQIKTKSREEKRSNSEENAEAKDFKKSKKSLPMIIENNKSLDTVPIEEPVENSVETAASFDTAPIENSVETPAKCNTIHYPKSPSCFTADSSIKKIVERNQCLICKKDGGEKILENSDALDVHILEEHPDSSHQFYFRCHYKEGTCRRHFTRFSFFKKHVISDHQEEILAGGSLLPDETSSKIKIKNYCCKVCKKTFRHGRVLSKHLNRCHVGDERVLTCPSCGHIFQTRRTLSQHQRNYHSDLDKSSAIQD